MSGPMACKTLRETTQSNTNPHNTAMGIRGLIDKVLFEYILLDIIEPRIPTKDHPRA